MRRAESIFGVIQKKGQVFGPDTELPREKSSDWMGICIINLHNEEFKPGPA